MKIDFKHFIERSGTPTPWSEGDNIPWNDPDFSKRMLVEHLSQNHDMASRKFDIIDQQVSWIKDNCLSSSGKILDLGCGPGLYLSRFAKLGLECYGIDYSPASIDYAINKSNEEGLINCKYLCEDIRVADFGKGYDLVMMTFGEFNVFSKDDGEKILEKAKSALNTGGTLLLEVHTLEAVKSLGEKSPQWFSSKESLFSDEPHITLIERIWNEETLTAVHRYYIVKNGCDIERMGQSIQGYSENDYKKLLNKKLFSNVKKFPSGAQDDFVFYKATSI